MLAYLSWHRAAAGVEQGAYERALERFHRSLAHRPPSGQRGSAALRVPKLPWLAPVAGAEDAPGYEDWYLIEDWGAVGVLEEAAVSHGHFTAHDRVAALAGSATGAVYRLVEGSARLDALGTAVWVSRAPGHEHPSLAALLGDGLQPGVGGLWRRCLGLGPAPEFCLQVGGAVDIGALVGVAPDRLPVGWTAEISERAVIWSR
jgi:hypothetical protein